MSSGFLQSLAASSEPCKEVSVQFEKKNTFALRLEPTLCQHTIDRGISQGLWLCTNVARINETVDRPAVGHNHPLLSRVCFQDNFVGGRNLVVTEDGELPSVYQLSTLDTRSVFPPWPG